ncbi:MAG: UbiA family prenyltransferase [Eubacteriales bacterium]|nr:UbiA family prenyltransferase [Eubacteriales bacterium]
MLSRFFDFVEIKTKIASFFPFVLGIAILLKMYGSINAFNTSLFFISMIIFDMATTALNNFIDTRTNGQPLAFSRPVSLSIILVMLAGATAVGIVLAIRSDLIVLLAGAACFAVGIFYTFGPAPISRMPLGELFSGIFMGFFIPFLLIQVNAPSGSLAFAQLDLQMFTIALRWPALLLLGLWTVTPMAVIANIMLANNICDVEHDRTVNRFTLPHYTGIPTALNIFASLYYISLLSWIALVALQQLSAWSLIALVVVIPVEKNIRKFRAIQSKQATFVVSIQNFMLLMIPLIGIIFIP